ncbi:MAG: ABC transporter ATP-binding protein [Candidatus Thorarchaeota archaeon]|nr:MAG: ABC transporter ATP-binding protein [Candidatus Thorarchaeota archaeon]
MGEIEIHALRGVSLQIKKGAAIGIMGPSGSGKTTLLNLIGALDRPSQGSVILDNVDITNMNESELTKVRRNRISYVFQFFNLLPVLSAYENIELPLLIGGVDEDARKERVDHLLSLVNLTERADHRPDELSGGEQQRVAIARALAKPSGSASSTIVLADEPTGDLDHNTGKEILDVLVSLTKKEGGTLITVTHDPEVGEKMDKVYKMRDGQIENKK